MSKIDQLITDVATMNQKLDSVIEKYNSIHAQVCVHEINLNGNNEQEGLNEWRRNFNKRHALISSLVPTGIVIAYEIIKYKLTGRY